MSDTVETLLDAAENRIRLKGYHAVSFRDLADELGIKSSSVHYHFPQKKDLGVALVDRYTKNFFDAVNQQSKDATSFDDRLRALCAVYKMALNGTDRICLCGILGAESAGLPKELSKKVSDFFEATISWLTNAQPLDMHEQERMKHATHIVASLQGGMMMANSLKDHSVLDRSIEGLLQQFA